MGNFIGGTSISKSHPFEPDFSWRTAPLDFCATNPAACYNCALHITLRFVKLPINIHDADADDDGQ